MSTLSLRTRFAALGLASIQTLTAATVITSVSVTSTRSVHADVTITEEARQHFAAGVALLKDPDGAKYEEAYREFKAAYKASPSWKILGNLGLCALKLERDGEAIDAYEKYIAEGGDNLDPGEKKQVETDLKTLKTGAFSAKFTVNQKAVTIEDARIASKGDRVVNIYGPTDGAIELRLHPGHHVITTKAAGFKDATWEVDLAPGGSDSHAFTLDKDIVIPPPTTAKDRPIPTTVVVGAIATGAFLAGGVVVGFMASSKKKDFDNQNDGSDPTGAQKLKDDGKKLNLIADICFGGAVVAASITTILYFSRPEVSTTKDTGGTNITPGWTPGGGVLMVSGAF
jgi:hypothetical protein